MEYTVLVKETTDGYFIAACPAMPEARAQGRTYDECLAAIKEVVELCIDYRTELGEELSP